jgi:hypothetical protein
VSEIIEGRRGLWRIAGILAIAHVVLMLVGLSMGKVATAGSAPSAYITAYMSGPVPQRLAGLCLAGASFLVTRPIGSSVCRAIRATLARTPPVATGSGWHH